MKQIKIITDSCADLTPEIMAEYDIDYCKMNTVYKGKEIPASLSWEGYSAKELYDTMRGGERVTTTQVPVTEFKAVFGKYAKDYDIIFIACCVKQSATVKTGEVVANEMMKEDPSIKIAVIDSLNACLGEGMLVVEAAKMVKKGADFDTVVKTITDKRKKVNEYVTVHSLEWLRKAGRVKASAAFFGNLMGVKPILIADKSGAQTAIKKVKGRATSLNEIVNMLSLTINEDSEIWCVTADCPQQDVDLLKKLIDEKIPGHTVRVFPMGPIIGASCGPDTIGVWGFGKEVTYLPEEN